MWNLFLGDSSFGGKRDSQPQISVPQAHVAVEEAEAKAAAAERKAKAAAPSKRKRESAALVAQHSALVAVADAIPQVKRNC